jgi:SAM-dependent methyltransferase
MPKHLFQPLIKFGKPLDMRSLNRDIGWRMEIAEDQRRLADALRNQLNQQKYCPICGHTHVSRYVTVFDYPYDICESCGHVYCATPPKDDAVGNLYTSDSKCNSVQSKIYLDDGLFSKRIEAIARPKVNFVHNVMSSLKKTSYGKWIDIGSGAGEVLSACADVGWDALGIESDREECEFAQLKGLNVINEYLSEGTFSTLLENAQVVSCFNVLEHIADPLEFVKNIANVLDEGFLVFEVPRHPSLSSLSAELFPDMACRHIYPPDHLHIFSEESINKLLAGTDFTVVGKWYFGQDFFDFISSAGANQGIGSNSIWEEIASAAPNIQQVIDEKGLSDTVIIVAYKDKK